VDTVGGRTRAVPDPRDVRIGGHHSFTDEEAARKVEVVAGGSHRHGERLARHPDLQRLLYRKRVRSRGRHPAGNPDDSISAGYASHAGAPSVVVETLDK